MRLLFIFLFTLPLHAHDQDWTRPNLKTFSHCFNFKKFDKAKKINPALLSTICTFLVLNDRKYYHHSDYRHSTTNKHHYGNALDFRVHSYEGLNRREKLTQYLQDLENLQQFLKLLELTDKVGLGIYPQAHNPFFHLDMRGKKGRWAEIDDEYVDFWLGVNWIKRLID